MGYMKLQEFLNHFDKPVTEIYSVLKDIPLPDLEYAYKQIILKERFLPNNPIPVILSYLPTGNKTLYQSILNKITKYGTDTDENNYLIIYNKTTPQEKKLITKMGGVRKTIEMDRDKLFYQIKELTEINTQKLLENK